MQPTETMTTRPGQPATGHGTPRPVVRAVRLGKVFRDFWRRPKVAAVRDLNLEVLPGEVFGLLGPNGSGKSTTLKLLLGLLHPTRGRVELFGRPPRSVAARARIGYLPESSCLYPYLTSEETLDFYGRLFDLSRPVRRDRTAQLFDMIGLKHARRRAVGELSKGMARRIGLAQALINDPDLVILDEPTSGLDPIGTRHVKDLITRLAGRGKTVILASHLLADVEDVCDRIAILFNGSVCARGRVSELLETPDRCRLTFPAPPPDRLAGILSSIRETVGAEPAVDTPRTGLEEFFLEVVRREHEKGPAPSGVGPATGVADYLAGKRPAGDALLQSLVGPRPRPSPEPEIPDSNASAKDQTPP